MRQECDDYPVCAMPLASGDRFLLYPDGVIEPEDAQGNSFGSELEKVVHDGQGSSPSEPSDQLPSAVRRGSLRPPASRTTSLSL